MTRRISMRTGLVRLPLVWLVAALTSAAIAGGARAAVYKWVDEKGVTHYSEKPPQGKKPAELPIRTQPAPASSEDSARRAKTWQEQEAEFQQRRIEQEERRVKQEALDKDASGERRRVCLRAREDLHVLEQQRPVYTINEKGERVYIDDKDRERARERLLQIAERNCANR